MAEGFLVGAAAVNNAVLHRRFVMVLVEVLVAGELVYR